MIYLTGLKDDYEHDGRVITEVLSAPNGALSGSGGGQRWGPATSSSTPASGSSAAFTLQADTKAIESSSPGDFRYLTTDHALPGRWTRSATGSP